jgi:hypothetical protein
MLHLARRFVQRFLSQAGCHRKFHAIPLLSCKLLIQREKNQGREALRQRRRYNLGSREARRES